MRNILIASLALATAIPAFAQAVADEQTELEDVAERGRLLAVLDRAAQRATQDMLAAVPAGERGGISGYVIEPDASGSAGAIVTFYADGADGPVGFYRATIGRDGTVAGARLDGAALTPVQRRMAEARDAAEALDREPCGIDMFNSFVLPVTAADAPAEVYLLSPQTARESFPSGGHYRVTFGADGQVLDSEALASGCGTIDLAPAELEATAPGATPNPLHMFIAAKTGKRLAVAAGGRQWTVDVTGIRPGAADTSAADAEAVRTRGRETGR